MRSRSASRLVVVDRIEARDKSADTLPLNPPRVREGITEEVNDESNPSWSVDNFPSVIPSRYPAFRISSESEHDERAGDIHLNI